MTARSTFRPALLAIAALLVIGAAPAAAFNPQPDPPGRQHIGDETMKGAAIPHGRVLIKDEVH